ncbi:PaaI family thioesterase [Nocardioides pacificus]
MTADATLLPPAHDPLLGLAPTVATRVPPVPGWIEPRDTDDGYEGLLAELRSLLDHVAAARLDATTARELTDQIAAVRDRLSLHAVAEVDQVFSRRPDLPGNGQTMVPTYVVRAAGADHVSGTITFGRYFLGANGAVHGGAITCLFENLLGQLAVSAGRTFARAAYTHVDFRSVTPVGRELTVRAWFVSEIGRKRILRGELRDGDVLCAEAEGLVIELRPGQP